MKLVKRIVKVFGIPHDKPLLFTVTDIIYKANFFF